MTESLSPSENTFSFYMVRCHVVSAGLFQVCMQLVHVAAGFWSALHKQTQAFPSDIKASTYSSFDYLFGASNDQNLSPLA